MPPFMEDMDQYMAALDVIARVNHIDEYVEAQRAKQGLLGTSGPVTQLPVDDDGDSSDDFGLD